MPLYIKRPEPGRLSRKETIIERIIEKPREDKTELDINALANAVAQAINLNMPRNASFVLNQKANGVDEDSFDNSKTMSHLADQMLVQRGDNKANFENLGEVKKTKKDKQDVDNTIDLLSKLQDGGK